MNQTFSNFELIIIDDGSQDLTLDILATILDPCGKAFSYPNAGANPNCNRGLRHSSSEYVSFLDADDLWGPDKLEAQYQTLQTNLKPGLPIVRQI